jgi:hypothetical protein
MGTSSAAAFSGSSPSSSPPRGGSHRPRRIGPSSTLRTSHEPSSSTTHAATHRSDSVARRRRGGGKAACRPCSLARQSDSNGQRPHAGPTGVHTVAPSSINASLTWPGGASSIRPRIQVTRRWRPSADLGSACKARTLAPTRMTLPSSTGSASPKANDATAAAV